MRRLVLLNALIFAVLAAAAALAYYGFTATSEQSSRERELELMSALAEEKVQNIESLIADADTKLMREVKLDELSQLGELSKTIGTAVVSIYVLDDQLKLIPDGVSVSQAVRRERLDPRYNEWFFAKVVSQMQ